jgi:hypothetical protein
MNSHPAAVPQFDKYQAVSEPCCAAVRSEARPSPRASKGFRAGPLITKRLGAGTKPVDEAGATMQEIVSSVKRVAFWLRQQLPARLLGDILR